MCSVSLPSTRATFRGTAVSCLRIERVLEERRTAIAEMWLCLDVKNCFKHLACSAPNFAHFVFFRFVFDLVNSDSDPFVCY